MTKIANVPQGASGTVNQQKWQLLEQIYKLYPLKKGIKVDGAGDYDFDDKLLTNVQTAEIAPSGDGKALTADISSTRFSLSFGILTIRSGAAFVLSQLAKQHPRQQTARLATGTFPLPVY